MSQATAYNETFNQRINIIIAVVVAVIAVLGSFITKLENEASTAANKASDAEQEYFYQAIGKQISGKADVNYAFGTVYQLWYQYEVQILSSQKRGETDAIKTLTELKEAVAQTSPLFDPQYFDKETGKVNLALYEADLYRRELYELEEKQAAADETASAWGDKSSNYILQLTLLAVAGFLLSLAIMTKTRISTLVFAISGTLMVVVISVWAYQVSIIPVSARSQAAITAFAEGASLSDQKRWDEALAKLNEAIKTAEPEKYGRAFLLRAQVHSTQGDFSKAIDDYKIALEAGFTGDPTVDANLVQAYFYIGDFASAIQTGKYALENSPDNLQLRQQVNMAYLASGDTKTATENTALLLEQATEKVNIQRQLGDNNTASEIWWLLNDAAHQYDQLTELLENKTARSPIKEHITDSILVGKTATELATQLRSGAIALKYNLPNVSNVPESGTASSPAKIDIQPIIQSKTPDGQYTYKVDMEFLYSGIEVGQLLSIVTYRNGIEEPSWNFSSEWVAKNGQGTASYTLSPSYSSLYIVPPGFYTVSVHLNGGLLAQSEFVVEDPIAQTDVDTNNDFVFDNPLDQFDLYASGVTFTSAESLAENTISYDPLFFFSAENDYIYFLEASYNYYPDYCTDPNNLNCSTINDSDGDGIQDENDNCALEPGSWDFGGCPISNDDYDADGISNDLDTCPYLTGLAENNGCPAENSPTQDPATLDSDGDGISDPDDQCLYEPGLVENNGCPVSTGDADGDSISNEFDTCTLVAGLAENNGCPIENSERDYDNDGIPDTTDSCIYSPGPESNLGCPVNEPEPPADYDNDGVLDTTDNCIYSPGPESNLGCPVNEPEPPADYDNDGIPDTSDNCPYSSGPESNGGCPVNEPEPPADYDNDGIPDASDGCPNEPGTIENDGCPDVPTSGHRIPDSDGARISEWLL